MASNNSLYKKARKYVTTKLNNLVYEKLNPAQSRIQEQEGDYSSTITHVKSIVYAYDNIPAVNRGVNYLVESISGFSYKVGDRINASTYFVPSVTSQAINPKKVSSIINIQPNPYQTLNAFYMQSLLDLILEGNCFWYFDGFSLFHLPSRHVVIHTDPKTFVKTYEYSSNIFYNTNEVIHIKEHSFRSIYRGQSKLTSAIKNMEALMSIDHFFTKRIKNGTVPNVVLSTDEILGSKMKESIEQDWKRRYAASSKTGGSVPVILDNGMTSDTIGNVDFRELDLPNIISINENRIYEVLGIPHVLINGGNNANIYPNLRMFFINTVNPYVEKIAGALTTFFGYDIRPDYISQTALQPDLNDQANFLTSLTNSGIITKNEARKKLNLPVDKSPDSDTLITPANIAGSSLDPNTGGRPMEDSEGKE